MKKLFLALVAVALAGCSKEDIAEPGHCNTSSGTTATYRNASLGGILGYSGDSSAMILWMHNPAHENPNCLDRLRVLPDAYRKMMENKFLSDLFHRRRPVEYKNVEHFYELGDSVYVQEYIPGIDSSGICKKDSTIAHGPLDLEHFDFLCGGGSMTLSNRPIW